MVVPLLEIKFSKKPIAIIKSGDRQLSFVKINKFDSKYFAVADSGVYELDDEYEYRYKNTSIYLYNYSNCKPLNLSSLAEIDTKLRESGDSELMNYPKLFDEMDETKVKDMELPPDRTKELSPISRRFLLDYSSDDEQAKTNTMVKVHSQKKFLQSTSPHLLGIGYNRSHYAIVQIGYKKLDFVPMIVHDNRAYTKYGVFELQQDNIYLIKKQILSFFILDDKTGTPREAMPGSAQKLMGKMAKKKEWKKMDSFHIPKFSTGVKEKLKKNVTLSAEKSLIQYVADSPDVFKTTLKELHSDNHAIETRISDPLTKAIPIVVVMAVLMGFVMLLSNVEPIMDAVAKYMGITPPVIQIIQMSEDEALEAGYDPDLIEGLLIEGDPPPDPTMVVDQAIVLTVPDSIVVESDNTNGARVEWIATAVDELGNPVEVVCDPKSTTIFPIGDRTVTCRATLYDAETGEVIEFTEKMFNVNVWTDAKGTIITDLIPKLPPVP